jgi:hypothetical protein
VQIVVSGQMRIKPKRQLDGIAEKEKKMSDRPLFRFAFETPCFPTTFWKRVYVTWRVFQLLGVLDSPAMRVQMDKLKDTENG